MNEKPILFSGAMVRAILDGRKTQTRRVVRYPHSWLTPYADGDKAKAFELFHQEAESFWNCMEGTQEAHWQCGDERLPQNYQVGDRLWVKETFAICSQVDGNGFPDDRPYLDFAPLKNNPKFGNISADYIIYRADGETEFADEDGGFLVRKDGSAGSLWKPNIFMCREYSRITLEIVAVRVERLQQIRAVDCIAEGVEPHTIDLGMGTVTTFRNYLTGETNAAAYSSYQSLWESINGAESWAANPWVWAIEFKMLKS